MSIKRLLILIGLALGALSLNSCGQPEGFAASAEGQSQVQQDQQITIALVMSNRTNPLYAEIERGARQAEKDLGVRLVVKTAAQETSVDQQIQAIEDLIQEKVNAIVVAPVDSLELIPALKKAQDAGIVIITIENPLNAELSHKVGLNGVAFVGANNELGAYEAARVITSQLSEPTKTLILEGKSTTISSEDRKNGALRAFRENTNIVAVITESAHWKIDEAYQVTQSQFVANPDIGAIFCANDMMALGALEYLKQAGRTDVLVAGFDAIEQARQSIQGGRLSVTVDQQAAMQGYLGVHYASKAVSGEDIPAKTIVDHTVATAQSIEQ
jgi:ribose transport system substrate-binding protein